MNKREISNIDILEFALEGVTTKIGANTGNPMWSPEDWQYYYNAQKEIERRIRIAVSLQSFHRRTRVPA